MAAGTERITALHVDRVPARDPLKLSSTVQVLRRDVSLRVSFVTTTIRHVRDPEHRPLGDPCGYRGCGLPASRHYKRNDAARLRRNGQGRARRQRARDERRRGVLGRDETIVGIDGEGKGREPHRYTYLSAVDEHGHKLGSIADPHGLSSEACLEFLLSLGKRRLFGFGLGYDFAMWLRELNDGAIYRLVRPELRSRHYKKHGKTYHAPILWRGLDLQWLRRKLSLRRARTGADKPGPWTVIWDVFAFYQGRFTKALSDWQTTSASVIEHIASMKERRSAFDSMAEHEIQDYCDKECELLALLVRQLVNAHEAARLDLTGFYGAGSTGSALLTKLGVRDKKSPPPREMWDAVARGFVGGRFELSRHGPVRVPCHGHDISSAYPYQMHGLPCLVHGRWRLETGSPRGVDRAVRRSRLALVHCRVRRSGPTSWGPLPWRWGEGKLSGRVVFPLATDGTWCWQDEYRAAKETLWPGVEAQQAWCYDTPCDCAPFAEIAETYRERYRIGKDAAGIVLKLGMNSCYGKTAQSVGRAPFQSFVWAGLITSGTRAQLLRAIAAARDPRSVLMFATDGVLATERLKLPKPRDTGTGETPKPLGGWEVKSEEWARGVFLARPGIYWPLGVTEDEQREVKARGISRSVLYRHAARIEAQFARSGWRKPYKVGGKKAPEGERPQRFWGLVQGVRRCKAGEGTPVRKGPGKGLVWVKRGDEFCDWTDYDMKVSFGPDPKRAEVLRGGRLAPWEYMPGESAPYDRASVEDPEALEARRLELMMAEQPDGDVVMR